MKKLFMTALWAFIAVFPFLSLASQEAVLPTSYFEVISEGVSNSGRVKVKAQRDRMGKFKFVKVEAFHRTLKIEKKLIEVLPKDTNGVQISFEEGYEETGGKLLYIAFTKGFSSGSFQKTVILIPEKGPVRLLDKDNKN